MGSSGISGKLKSNADFHCRKCLEGKNSLFQSVLLNEVVIEPILLECVPKFCCLGDTLLDVGGGVEETAKARVRCTWAKFKELSYSDSSGCSGCIIPKRERYTRLYLSRVY